MKQQVYIIYNDKTECLINAISSSVVIDAKVRSDNLEVTTDMLLRMARGCPTDYFYIINTRKEVIFDKFDFSFEPGSWDKEYVHIWNDSSIVRLYNKDLVLSNPGKFSDSEIRNGNVNLKSIDENIYSCPIFDIIFIGYDEWFADDNFNILKRRFPRAKRIDNVNGIFEAHRAAADISLTDMFYVVDADAEVLPEFNFDYNPDVEDRQSVHVWHSRNPVNSLEYGYGGIKLFPTWLLRGYNEQSVDFTTSVSKSLKVIQEVSNITRFNTDPFTTWRSAFRECVKLSAKAISGQIDKDTEYRLDIWCSIGKDAEFGEFCILGANDGRKYGTEYAGQPDRLRLINDFSWLEDRFSKC